MDIRWTYKAATLKAKYKIAYAECFAAALTSSLKAFLVTGDENLMGCSKNFQLNGQLQLTSVFLIISRSSTGSKGFVR